MWLINICGAVSVEDRGVVSDVTTLYALGNEAFLACPMPNDGSPLNKDPLQNSCVCRCTCDVFNEMRLSLLQKCHKETRQVLSRIC